MDAHLVRRERLGLAQDLEALLRRLVERVDHQVQVGRQGAHARDLGLLGSCETETETRPSGWSKSDAAHGGELTD